MKPSHQKFRILLMMRTTKHCFIILLLLNCLHAKTQTTTGMLAGLNTTLSLKMKTNRA